MRTSNAITTAVLLASLVLCQQAAFGQKFENRIPNLIPSLPVRSLFTATRDHSPRTALAARQRLSDQVRIAMQDGYISPDERVPLLVDAQNSLSPNEYAQFKQMLDQVSPPKPVSAKKAEQLARSRAVAARRMALQMPKPTNPVIPAGATLPDRPASSIILR